MTTDFYIKRGDSAPAISAVLKDKLGNPVNLVTATTINFYMRNFLTGVISVSGLAAKDPDQTANAGKVSYTWGLNNTAQAGYYSAEWEVIWPGNKPQTFPTAGWHLIDIVEDLDAAMADATFANVRTLRRMIGEPTRDPYTDTLLAAIIARDGSLNSAAASVWRDKAATYADLVDISDAGSSRKLSQLWDRATKQAAIYEAAAATTPPPGGGGIAAGRLTTTRLIERA